MASSLVKRCSATGFSLLRRISAGSVGSSRHFADRQLGAQMTMMMTTGVDSRKMSPWLMLPPVFEEGGDMVYKFYNLSEDKEESFRKKRSNKSEEETADDDAKFVGSSHGWLALFNQRNNHLFLYNPITNRHIKLPPIETLPGYRIDLTPNGRGSVSKLILSSSPDDGDDECIAMMTFGLGDRLAFCHPCRSTEWTPIGDLFFSDLWRNQYVNFSYGRAYEDFVYCSTLKRFTCITQTEIDLVHHCLCHPTSELEDWDLSDLNSPVAVTCSSMGGRSFSFDEWINQNLSLLYKCRQIPYLVFTEQHDQLFMVIRFVIDRVDPGGLSVPIEKIPYDLTSQRLLVDMYPHKTIGFCVLEVSYSHEDDRVVRKVNDVTLSTLGGLTMFIGMNHSFAVSSAKFPNLKPNSIYFTDANKHSNSIYAGHDIGIFDFADKTLSDCHCYPCVDVPSLKMLAAQPMWFTPSL